MINDPAGRPATVAKTPAPARIGAATDSGVSSIAVDGGSSAGRAPKAAWITSTIPSAWIGFGAMELQLDGTQIESRHLHRAIVCRGDAGPVAGR